MVVRGPSLLPAEAGDGDAAPQKRVRGEAATEATSTDEVQDVEPEVAPEVTS